MTIPWIPWQYCLKQTFQNLKYCYPKILLAIFVYSFFYPWFKYEVCPLKRVEEKRSNKNYAFVQVKLIEFWAPFYKLFHKLFCLKTTLWHPLLMFVKNEDLLTDSYLRGRFCELCFFYCSTQYKRALVWYPEIFVSIYILFGPSKFFLKKLIFLIFYELFKIYILNCMIENACQFIASLKDHETRKLKLFLNPRLYESINEFKECRFPRRLRLWFRMILPID